MAIAKGTAWGELEFVLGSGNPSGVVKQGSYSLEYQDGETKEWTAIGGRIVDQRTLPGNLRITYELKGIPLGKFKGGSDGTKTTLTITPKDGIGEALSFEEGTFSLAPLFADDGGYGTRVTYSVITAEDSTLMDVSDAAGV